MKRRRVKTSTQKSWISPHNTQAAKFFTSSVNKYQGACLQLYMLFSDVPVVGDMSHGVVISRTARWIEIFSKVGLHIGSVIGLRERVCLVQKSAKRIVFFHWKRPFLLKSWPISQSFNIGTMIAIWLILHIIQCCDKFSEKCTWENCFQRK